MKTRASIRAAVRVRSTILPALFAVLLWAPQSAGAATATLLQDDFNRPDSSSLGSPWTESNESATARIEVNSQALAFHYTASGPPGTTVFTRPYAYAPLAEPVSFYPVTISFSFSPHADERMFHDTGLMTSADGFGFLGPVSGLGVRISRTGSTVPNSTIQIHRRSANVYVPLATLPLPFQFESGSTYSVVFTIMADYSSTVRITDGTNTATLAAPATPFVTPLDQYFLNDVQGGVSGGGPAGEYYLRFDNVVVTQNVPTSAADCKNGGWESYGAFKNQGDCVSFVGSGGKNEPEG